MKTTINPWGVSIWLSANDTYDWAHKPGATCPCSHLSGKRVWACFDRNGLCDLTVNGRRASDDLSSDELNAICADYLAVKLPKDHDCYFVVVGQFQRAA